MKKLIIILLLLPHLLSSQSHPPIFLNTTGINMDLSSTKPTYGLSTSLYTGIQLSHDLTVGLSLEHQNFPNGQTTAIGFGGGVLASSRNKHILMLSTIRFHSDPAKEKLIGTLGFSGGMHFRMGTNLFAGPLGTVNIIMKEDPGLQMALGVSIIYRP